MAGFQEIDTPHMSSNRKIVGFHQDHAGDWVADLACGHTQHVRHNPPWTVRSWVLSPEGRAAHLGRELPCPQCVPAPLRTPDASA